jgi:hypothetical protein
MKKTTWIIGLLLMVFLSGNYLVAQEVTTGNNQQKKLTRAEKKKLKEEAEKANWEKIVEMVKAKQFVFMASYFYTPNGNTMVNPSTNFFSVDRDNAVVQISFMNLEGVPTRNDIGGITAKCSVDKYTYDYDADDHNKPITIRVSARPLAGQGTGIYQLDLTIYSDGSGEMQMGRYNLRMNGRLSSPDNARIFQGNTR